MSRIKKVYVMKLTPLDRVLLLCRIGFLVMGAAIFSASLSSLVEAQNRYDGGEAVVSEKVAGHDARIKIAEDEVRELQAEMREMSSQVSTIRGMGMGFGFIVILLQIVQFMTDRRLKFRESEGE